MELLPDAALTGSLLLARARALHLQNVQAGENTRAAEPTAALSLVWEALCAQLTPEEQLSGTGEHPWEQERSEQLSWEDERTQSANKETHSKALRMWKRPSTDTGTTPWTPRARKLASQTRRNES